MQLKHEYDELINKHNELINKHDELINTLVTDNFEFKRQIKVLNNKTTDLPEKIVPLIIQQRSKKI